MQNPHQISDPALSAGGLSPEEARAAPRVELRLPARLVFADLSQAVAVTLRDASIGGVRLLLPHETALPKDVYLMVRQADGDEIVRLRCETRWQVAATAGLRFANGADPAMLTALLARIADAA